MSERHVQVIRSSPLFEGYTADGARMLLEAGEVREHGPDVILLREGEPPSCVLLVLAGRLEVFVEREGRHVVLGEAKEGVVLGELSFLGKIPRAASVRTLEPSSVLHWSSDAFDQLLRGDPYLSKDVTANTVRLLIARERSLIDSMVRLQKYT